MIIQLNFKLSNFQNGKYCIHKTNGSENPFETSHVVCKPIEATTPNYKTNQQWRWHHHKLKIQPKPIQVDQHTS